MKNILILSSSPRRGGNSDTLCDRFMAGSLDKGHHVEKIFLADKHINYCTGCSVCSLYGKPCPQKDDVAELVEKMIQADVIVLATPVYFYTMCAQLKTLIDRSCARYTAISNKEFYFILTAADPDIRAMDRTLESLRAFTEDCLEGSREKGVLYGVGAMEKGDVRHLPVFREAYETGRAV